MMDHAAAELSPLDAVEPSDAHDLDWPEESAPRPEIAAELPFASTLDLLRMSVIMTDAGAHILHANRDACSLLGEQRFLRNAMGKLSAVNPKCAHHLAQAIRASTEADVSAISPLGIAVPLVDADERSIAAWVLPVRQESGRRGQQVAAIFIRGSIDVLSEHMFALTFNATAAEIRVLKLLLAGMTIDEAKVALNLSRNTVSTHVKSLFAKTGATRQAELLRIAAPCIAPASAEDVCPRPTIEARRLDEKRGWPNGRPLARRRSA